MVLFIMNNLLFHILIGTNWQAATHRFTDINNRIQTFQTHLTCLLFSFTILIFKKIRTANYAVNSSSILHAELIYCYRLGEKNRNIVKHIL